MITRVLCCLRRIWRIGQAISDGLSDAVATGERDDPDLRRALSAPLTSLFPLCRLIQADDLLQEEAAAFVAANAP